jgi:hypothetical protein
MKVAIHQPQYLPWLLYFLKIQQSDVFIFLDSVSFQKNGLQNRNQIKTAQGAHWLTVPVTHQFGQKLVDVKINNSTDWRRKHWETIHQCYGRAVAFKQYAGELEWLYSREWIGLNEFNIEMMNLMLRWMNIQTPILRSSQMQAKGTASDLVLNLCLEVGATTYYSGVGGRDYLDSDAFEQAGVTVEYQESLLPAVYPQLFPKAGFINDLSALDILLNCGETWRSYLPEKVAKK